MSSNRRTRNLPGAFRPAGPDAERTARYGFPVQTTEGPSSAAVRASQDSSDQAAQAAALRFLAATSDEQMVWGR